jgi:hypothetical protein
MAEGVKAKSPWDDPRVNRPVGPTDLGSCDFYEKRIVNGKTIIFRCVKPYGHNSEELHSQLNTHHLGPEA